MRFDLRVAVIAGLTISSPTFSFAPGSSVLRTTSLNPKSLFQLTSSKKPTPHAPSTLCMCDHDISWHSVNDRSSFDAPARGPGMNNGGIHVGRNDGNGKGHGYSRDTSLDASVVDEAAVDTLLSLRADAKRRRDYDTADVIRDQLLNDYTVRVCDMKQTWRTSYSSSLNRAENDDDDDDDRGNRDYGHWHGTWNPLKDFVPNGHDYSPSKDMFRTMPAFSEIDTYDLLANRLQMDLIDAGVFAQNGMKESKANGSPGTHDKQNSAVKLVHSKNVKGSRELVAGTFVNDRSNCEFPLVSELDGIQERRIHGISFGNRGGDGSVPERLAGGLSKENRRYARKTHSAAVKGAKDPVINTSENERNKHGPSLVSVHDGLRNLRASTFPVSGVVGRKKVSERTFIGQTDQNSGYTEFIDPPTFDGAENFIDAEWIISGDFGKNGHMECAFGDRSERFVNKDSEEECDTPQEMEGAVGSLFYVESSASLELSPEEAELVQLNIDERAQAILDGDIETADTISNDLAVGFNVTIHDKLKQWSVGGDFGPDSDHREPHRVSTRREVGDVTEEDVDPANGVIAGAIFEDAALHEVKESSGKSSTAAIIASVKAESPLKQDPPSFLEKDLLSLTVAQLKERLRLSDLPLSGRKADLVERLMTGASEISIEPSHPLFSAYSLTVAQLRDRLRTLGLSLSGTKPQLVERLENDLRSLTVAQLKERLRASGLPLSGRKSELVKRLMRSL